jgi:cytochrome oxidase Cu insertion factor (SCO1/SenC/PrrC family)
VIGDRPQPQAVCVRHGGEGLDGGAAERVHGHHDHAGRRARRGTTTTVEAMPLSPGDEAPDFTLQDAGGEEVPLSRFRGRKVLVYFYPDA